MWTADFQTNPFLRKMYVCVGRRQSSSDDTENQQPTSKRRRTNTVDDPYGAVVNPKRSQRIQGRPPLERMRKLEAPVPEANV